MRYIQLPMWFRRRHSKIDPNPPRDVSVTSKPLSSDPVATQLLLQTREIHLTGEIDDAMATSVIAKLLFLSQQDQHRPIVLILNSIGGSATAGLAIMDTMQFVTAPVHVIARESACGMALFLLIAGCPGHRFATPQTWLHNATLVGTGTTPKDREYLVRLKATLQERLTTLTKLTAAEANDTVESDRTFTVEEALHAGIIDAIAPAP